MAHTSRSPLPTSRLQVATNRRTPKPLSRHRARSSPTPIFFPEDPRGHTGSTCTLRSTIAAARCSVSIVTLPSLGSSMRSSCVRLVPIIVASRRLLSFRSAVACTSSLGDRLLDRARLERLDAQPSPRPHREVVLDPMDGKATYRRKTGVHSCERSRLPRTRQSAMTSCVATLFRTPHDSPLLWRRPAA